jgi:hypothetical protein
MERAVNMPEHAVTYDMFNAAMSLEFEISLNTYDDISKSRKYIWT